ncbi:MAG: hypothetical protein GWO44_23015 [Thermoplasmata archaeon]|nr:hypothetical protein [Thermoplasmata archaeon]NIY06056.1 hypothetical protein [Thermoplasmata archaeon]
MEFKTYKVIKPGLIGKAMTKGWTPVAAINYDELVEGTGLCHTTRFLIGKGAKKVQSLPGAGPTPVVMYPQPDTEEPPADSGQLQQLLDRIALMSQEEVLALHAELQEQRAAPSDEAEEDAAVTEAMDELLGDDEDDGTDDDDDE